MYSFKASAFCKYKSCEYHANVTHRLTHHFLKHFHYLFKAIIGRSLQALQRKRYKGRAETTPPMPTYVQHGPVLREEALQVFDESED